MKTSAEGSPSNEVLGSLANRMFNISVTTANQDVRSEVEKSLAKFRIDTLALSKNGITKEGIAQWYLNMVNLNKVAFDEINKIKVLDNEDANRLSLFFVNAIVSKWLSTAMGDILHEKGHEEASTALGGISEGYRTSKTGDKPLNLGQLFLAVLLRGGGASYVGSQSYYTFRDQAVLTAAGINQETNFSEEISHDSIKSGKFYTAEALHYLYNKIELSLYSFGDPNSSDSDVRRYVESLVGQGIIDSDTARKTTSKIANYSLLTALVSGRTWDALRSQMEYIRQGASNVDLVTFETSAGRVTWPEFNTYLNRNGISIGGETSLIRPNHSVYTVGVEKPVIGRDGIELSCEAYIPCGPFHYTVSGRANINGTFGGHLQMGYDLKKSRWAVYGGADYDTGTLQGMRKNFTDDNQAQVFFGSEYKF